MLHQIPVHWLENEPVQNFGDYLSDFIFRELFFPIGIACDELRIIGSCIDDCFVQSALEKKGGKSGQVVFWGCGLRDDSGISKDSRKASRFLAVRGPLTRSILKLGDDIPVGDPALLMPALYVPRALSAICHLTLLVPHFHDQRSDAELKVLSGCDKILRPNIENDLDAIGYFIDQITSADFVLCGSLHAAIIAVAYGKPYGYWDSGDIDIPFKWQDFAASINTPCEFFINVAEAKAFYNQVVKGSLTIPDMWPMLVSAPLAVKPEVVARVFALDYKRHGGTIFQVSVPRGTSSLIIQNLQQVIGHSETIARELSGQIHSLNEQVSSRDAQIEHLAQALSDRDVEVTHLHSSVADQIHSMNEQVFSRDTQIEHLAQSLSERDVEIDRLRGSVAERDRHVECLSDALVQHERKISALQRALDDHGLTIDAIVSSTSWRITTPIRAIKALILDPGIPMRRVGGRVLRRVYHRLPISHYRKAQLKHWLFERLGFLLSRTNTYKKWAEYREIVAKRSILLEASDGNCLGQHDDRVALRFNDPDAPVVSVVIPVYNNWKFTEACLRSIRRSSDESTPFEVLVADDCSTDNTREKLADIQGVRVIANEINLGFLMNCNNAVKHARGRYVVLLNNDTEVSKNWLKLMLDVFANFDRVGVVAGKLIYPDGRVQEAGGVMMKNGWGHPYGRLQDPAKYEFNYVKEVDCAIGACLMIDRELFLKIGGFDERYAPAHYEEFDFEFSVRAAGFRVMYQPAAEIIHHESVSGGQDFRDKQSAKNHKKFIQKWAAELPKRPDSDAELYLARDLSVDRKRILIVEDMVPQHDKHAGAVTIFQYVRLLRDLGFKVVYFPDNLCPTQPYTMDLQQLGVEVVYGNIDFKGWFTEYGAIFDYCWLCRPDVAIKYLDIIKEKSSARLLYYTHDLHFLREFRRHELEGGEWHLKESKRLKEMELEIFRRVDVVLTPSADEKTIIHELWPPARVLAIPAYMYDAGDLYSSSRASLSKDRKDILFLGGYGHVPNVDAVLWFVREVLPIVREQLPGVVFHIAGSNPPDEIKNLEGPGVRVRGYVSDLTQFFGDFRVFVAPLRYGAGVKGKIVTSLQCGVPVVTTSIGNEGLNLVHGEQALIGDSPADLADHICRLYQDEHLWVRLAAEGREFIRSRFSIDSARNAVLSATGICAERCYVCGLSVFYSPDSIISNLREAPICPSCWTLKRVNDLAYTLVRAYGGRKEDSLKSMFATFSKLRIYEVGYVGPIHNLLSQVPNFVCSEYFDDIQIGDVSGVGVRCENVERLTFADQSFDLVISQDVFEHVADPIQGFREIYRVLRPEGLHAFTIPFSGASEHSFSRAEVIDGAVSLHAEPVYHGDPLREKGALVFTDFGRDLIKHLSDIGFEVELCDFDFPDFPGGKNIVFVTRKRSKYVVEETL